MSDDAGNQLEGRIEPSVRQINLLPPASDARERYGIGVLSPFSGLLQAGRFSPDSSQGRGPLGPPLAYLTLEPLVTRHLREHTVEERTVERLERVESAESPGEGGSADSPPQGDDEETRMTVREFIREQAAEQSTDDSDGRATPDQITQLTDFTQHSTTLHQQRIETSWPGETASTPGSPFGIDRPGTDDATPHDSGRSATEGTDQPSLTLETSRRSQSEPWTTDQGNTQRGNASSHDGRSDTTGPAASRSETGGEPFGRGAGRPDLVLPRRPPLTPQRDHASGDPSSIGDPTTEPSSVDRGLPGTEGQMGGDSGRSKAAVSDRSSAIRTQDPNSPGRESSERGAEAVPLSLDKLERPALDRFVEQLSDELARHDRIEHERRGL